jgi:hypothetical protein
MYQAIAAGPGYSIGDIIVRYDIIDVASSTILATIWFNQTTQTGIPAPAPADLVPIAAPSSVTVINGPLGAAVNIQDGGNSITVDASALDVALSTRNSEATQLLIQALLTTIDGDTSNLDVLLSTRASEATLLTRATEATLLTRASEATLLTRLSKADFEARINTLGQKAMAASTPVVIASDQSSLPITSTKLQTYSASTFGLSSAAVATDILLINGSATKTVKIKLIRITGTRTASATIDLLLIKRSTANSGGTSTTLVAVPHDSTNAAGTAIVLAYTANPTVGTVVGNFRTRKMFINTAGTGASDIVEWTFDSGESQACILNGVAQGFAVNLNGVTVTGGNFDISIEWTES